METTLKSCLPIKNLERTYRTDGESSARTLKIAVLSINPLWWEDFKIAGHFVSYLYCWPSTFLQYKILIG